MAKLVDLKQVRYTITMASNMETEDLLGMSLDQMIAAKPKKTFEAGGGGERGGRGGGGGGKFRSQTGRATRQQQSQPYTRQAAPKHSVGGGGGGGRGGGSNNNKVYVGNLAWTVTWKELKDLMVSCGPCKADVGIGPDGRSKVCNLLREDSRPILYRRYHPPESLSSLRLLRLGTCFSFMYEVLYEPSTLSVYVQDHASVEHRHSCNRLDDTAVSCGGV